MTDIISTMYEQEDDEPENNPQQPEQLRLAGKATLIPHQGKHLAVPKIEYVETLERMIVQQNKVITDLSARLKRLEIRQQRDSNIAHSKSSALQSRLQEMESKREY